jgi:hypothetical protein
VNLTNGSFTNYDVGAPTSITNRSTTALGNGWYRVNVTVQIDSTSTDGYLEMGPCTGSTSATCTYTGDGTSGIYIWGSQIEQGSFPTSYIPTGTNTVTRMSDNFTIPVTASGANGAWYTAGVGTLLANAMIPYEIGSGTSDAAMRFAGMDDGTTSNGLGLEVNGANSEGQAVEDVSGSLTYDQFSASGLSNNTLIKGAMSYNGTNVYSAFNGTSLTSGSSTSPTYTELRIGGAVISGVYYSNGWVNRVTYFPTAQPNSSLPEYTH